MAIAARKQGPRTAPQRLLGVYGGNGAIRFRAALGSLLTGLGASLLLTLARSTGRRLWLGGERRLARLHVSATDLGVAQEARFGWWDYKAFSDTRAHITRPAIANVSQIQ